MRIRTQPRHIYAPGNYAVAIDTPVRTYLHYFTLSEWGPWNPYDNGMPQLAQWEQALTYSDLRVQPFTPGHVLTQAQINYLLPATAPAATRISITDSPYNAQPAPADATTAIQAAITAAGAIANSSNPVDVVIPPGTYNYSASLLGSAWVRVYGAGGILNATTPGASTINMIGDGSSCLFVTSIGSATARSGAFHATILWIGNGASPISTGNMIVGCEAAVSAGAHVLITNVSGGIVAFNYAHDGYSDAFHFQTRCTYCQLFGNRTSMSSTVGDDMFAFVSPTSDGDPNHHCSCIANYGRTGPAHQITTSGGWYLDVEYNDTAFSNAAGVYNWQDGAFGTYGCAHNIFRYNKIDHANIASSHAGILCGSSNALSPSNPTNPSTTFGAIPDACLDTTIVSNTINNTQLGITHGQAIDIRSSSFRGTVALNSGSGNQSGVSIGAGTNMIVAANTFT
jgi:hypothetical protein